MGIIVPFLQGTFSLLFLADQIGLLFDEFISIHFGNLLLEKGFLLYFLCKCFSFTKELNKKGFFALTEVPIFSQFSS